MYRKVRKVLFKRSAFTLIELLIVVLIISVLAAIALPNFMGFQVRAKIARVKTDHRTIATALEAYAVDNGPYPPGFSWGLDSMLKSLTPLSTPVAYLQAVPNDVFKEVAPTGNANQNFRYHYGAGPIGSEARWILASIGPDLSFGGKTAILNRHLSFTAYQGYLPSMFYQPQLIGPNGALSFDYVLYDPTNGSISRGDIIRGSDIPLN